MTNYTKLRSGDWGLRSDAQLKPGTTVEVTTKAGDVKQETVANAIWNDGKIWLYGIRKAEEKDEDDTWEGNG